MKLAKIEKAQEIIDVPEDGYQRMLDDISDSLFCSGVSLDSNPTNESDIQEIRAYLADF